MGVMRRGGISQRRQVHRRPSETTMQTQHPCFKLKLRGLELL